MPPTKRPGLRLRPGSNSRLSVRMSASAPAGTRPHGSTRVRSATGAALDHHAALVLGDEAAQPLDRLAQPRGLTAVDRHPQQPERRAPP